MTREEFIERYRAIKAGDKWLGNVFVFVLILGCVLWPWLTDQVNQWGIPWLVGLFNHPWAILLLSFLLFGLFSGWNRRRQGLGAGMVCVNCGALLTRDLASIAIATGNCGACGKTAFDEVSA